MSNITSRQELKEYCLRRLGAPVLQINVADEQVEDRITDAFQYYFDYHYDAVEQKYYAHLITQEDIDNQYILLPESLIHVTKVLPTQGGGGLFYPMGDPSLAWNSTSVNPLFGGLVGGGDRRGSVRTTQGHAGGTGFSATSFYLSMANIELIQQLTANGEPSISFSRHTQRLHLNVDWKQRIRPNQYLVVEGWAALDPEQHTKVYNDRWLKRYATALIKQQWGMVLSKYSGVQLPGGVTFDGQTMYLQAVEEIRQLEDEMQLKYELPVDFYMG